MHTNVEFQQRRYFSAHHTMLRIARYELSEARQIGSGYSDAAFISITMICLAFEAVCNAIGDKLVGDWKDLEPISSPSVKARIICMTLGIEYDKAAHPWKILSEMLTLRNKIAHPKPELIQTPPQRMSEEKYELRRTHRPHSKLESRMNPKTADDAILAVDAALKLWGEKLDEDDQFDILHDSWTGSASRQPQSP